MSPFILCMSPFRNYMSTSVWTKGLSVLSVQSGFCFFVCTVISIWPFHHPFGTNHIFCSSWALIFTSCFVTAHSSIQFLGLQVLSCLRSFLGLFLFSRLPYARVHRNMKGVVLFLSVKQVASQLDNFPSYNFSVDTGDTSCFSVIYNDLPSYSESSFGHKRFSTVPYSFKLGGHRTKDCLLPCSQSTNARNWSDRWKYWLLL